MQKTQKIQKYSGDEDYSRQIRLQNSLTQTGKATDGTNYDVKCCTKQRYIAMDRMNKIGKIYDLMYNNIIR